jgi:serine/threonine-protein kinase
MADNDTVPCPTCGRAVSLADGACPYDGTPVDSATAIAVASTINPSIKALALPEDGSEKVVGERFGKYIVEALIGRGGMGTVYRVAHADLGNKFALKLMDPRVVRSSEAHTRFLREARAAARIDHPNVIRVLDHARHPTFGSYLVMELLSGTSLDKVLAEERTLDEARAIGLATQICDALAAAHEGGVVHRDLKPANVFLSRVRGGESVKVVDFGVAKVVADVATLLTRPGTVIGTPLYMSPEQWDNADLDARSDIYSFGVMLYEMVTGRTPIRGVGITEVAKNLATTKPIAPRVLRPELSPALEAIILRCIEKQASDRFASMRDVADALAQARVSPGVFPKPRTTSRRRNIQGLIAVAASVTVGVVAFQSFRGHSPASTPTNVQSTPSSSPATVVDAAVAIVPVVPAMADNAPLVLPTASSVPPRSSASVVRRVVPVVPRHASPRPAASTDELFGN